MPCGFDADDELLCKISFILKPYENEGRPPTLQRAFSRQESNNTLLRQTQLSAITLFERLTRGERTFSKPNKKFNMYQS